MTQSFDNAIYLEMLNEIRLVKYFEGLFLHFILLVI